MENKKIVTLDEAKKENTERPEKPTQEQINKTIFEVLAQHDKTVVDLGFWVNVIINSLMEKKILTQKDIDAAKDRMVKAYQAVQQEDKQKEAKKK